MISHTRLNVVVIVMCVVVLTGCSSFRSSNRLDLGPFGENTTAMVGEIKKGLTLQRSILAKPYLQGETLSQMKKQKDDIGQILGGIVLYSTQIVNLSRSTLTDQEKAVALGQYVTKLATPLIENKDPDIRVSLEKFETIVNTIKSRETFLNALGAAQPLVDAVDNYVGSALESMSIMADQVAAEAAARIDQHSAEVLENRGRLQALQVRSIRSFALLNELRAGDSGALDALLLNDPDLRKYVKQGTKVSSQNLDAMEHELMTRLQNNQILLDQLKPRIEQYHAETRELDDLMRSVENSIRKMRIAVILWSRSHANLAAGVTVPPEIDLGAMLTGTVKKIVP